MTYSIKAAIGKVNITPEEVSPLQGYDPETFIADPSKDLLDDLYAKVLVLELGGLRSVIVTVDCCLTNEDTVHVPDPGGREGMTREFIPTFTAGTKAKWAKAAGANTEAVSVCATHTHTAPAHILDKYTKRIEQLIADLTSKLAPVKLSVAEGTGNISAFRRPYLHKDFSVPINRKAMVLMVESEEGAPLGALVNYSVHATAIRSHMKRISGDIVGLAMTEVEKHFGGDFTAMFVQGFSGDICPTYGDSGHEVDTYPMVVEGSKVFATDIVEALRNRNPIEASKLETITKKISLTTREDFFEGKKDVTLFGLKLGELFFLAVSAEVFNDYMELFSRELPGQYHFLAGISNGYSGYVPTNKAFKDGLGGYEMTTTPFVHGVEDAFLSEVKSFSRLFAE